MTLRKDKLNVFNPNKLGTIEEGDEDIESPQSDTSANSDDSDTIAAIDKRRAELLLKRIAELTEESSSIHTPSPIITAGRISMQNGDGGTYETTVINPNTESILAPEVPVQISIIEVERENYICSEWVLWGIISLSFTIALNYIYNYDAPSR